MCMNLLKDSRKFNFPAEMDFLKELSPGNMRQRQTDLFLLNISDALT